jgi:hypothetical protein
MRAETIAAFSSPEVVQRLKQQFLTSILNTPEEVLQKSPAMPVLKKQ